jgi:hypothetical protein
MAFSEAVFGRFSIKKLQDLCQSQEGDCGGAFSLKRKEMGLCASGEKDVSSRWRGSNPDLDFCHPPGDFMWKLKFSFQDSLCCFKGISL